MKISPVDINPELFLKFSVERITDNSVTDFDLFLKVADHIVLYGGNGYRWFREEIQGLVNHQVDSFYIRPEDQRKAVMYENLAKLPQVEKSLAPHERLRSIEDVGATFTKCLYEGEITPACVDKAKSLSSALVDCVSEDKTCIQALSGLGDHDMYTYYHSVRVAAYTTAIAVQMGLTDEEQLRELALGGIFHDIGKKNVPVELINKTGALTEQEWAQMREHPNLGYLQIADTILSYVPKEIILHHHEKLDGSGYPDGLGAKSLLTEVQIAGVADIFDALTSTRSYQNKRSRFEALDFMRHKMLGTKVAAEPYEALISCLVAEKD